ncbi:alpha-(1-_3)-fucosyltransferase [Fragilaria crotonensis]|nr:alpha-(1->3)-fucosyltransferase [Fragilaria crotonensis]
MVTIKRPAKKPRSAGCNILIFLLLAQLVAVVFFFTSAPNRDPSPVPAVQGLKDRLRQSSQTVRPRSESKHSPDVGDAKDGGENGKTEIIVLDLKKDVDGEDFEHIQVNPIEDKVAGTHASGNNYFADFAYERQNPAFRHAVVADWTESHDKIVQQLPQHQIRSCQYKSDDHSILFHQACRKKGTKLVAYNSAHFERTWCGVSIAPGKAMEFPEYCDEPVKLFAKEYPPIDGQGMPPIEVKSKPAAVTAVAPMKDVECDIPCRYEENMQGDERYVSGTEWKIIHTMNDPNREDYAKVERTAFRQDVYYSTTSFKSAVPLSFFSFDEYDVFAPAVDFDKVDASGSYLVNSQCVAHATKRNRWAGAVADQFPVKSYGSCAHNTNLPEGKTIDKKEDRMELLRKHRFNLALEAGDAKDHITPAVWEAISSGTLPVILGAQNVKDHLPLDSFVAVSGLQKYADLGTLMAKVAGNKTEWQRYQTWRTNAEYKRQFDLKYNFTRTSPECRMCRWAYAKRYGLGWSHAQQYVHETAIDRKLCLDATTKLISNPVKESWHKVTKGEYSDILKAGDKSTCSEVSKTLSMTQDVRLTRTVSVHDNVVDIVLSDFIAEVPGSDIVLRLELPVLNAEGSYFPSPHILVPTARGAVVSSLGIQDAKSKVVVLASWHTEVTSTKEGVVEVIIRKSDELLQNEEDEMRRIRVVIEDMSELNDKATEFYPSSFAKLLIQDFVDPLELFYLEP